MRSLETGPNAGVQRRRTAPNEGRPLALPSPAQNILTAVTVPGKDDSELVASGMTERGAGAVRCNDLFGGILSCPTHGFKVDSILIIHTNDKSYVDHSCPHKIICRGMRGCLFVRLFVM